VMRADFVKNSFSACHMNSKSIKSMVK